MKKLILGNIIVFLMLLFIANLISYGILQWRANKYPKMLPNYTNKEKYLEYLRDKKKLRITYSAFEGWRHEPHKGKAITINKQGFRATVNPDKNAEKECWFLGGSVMWGSGNKDELTIPSLFAARTDSFMVYNYAEQSFNSRQCLARLVNLLSVGKQADLVISMDGINDIFSLCQKDIDMPGHSRSQAIQERLVDAERRGSIKKTLFYLREGFINVFLLNTLRLSSKIHHKIFGREKQSENLFNCLEDDDKIERIADQLIRNWELMHQLITKQGGEFVAILQPIVSLSKARTDHIEHKLIQAQLAQAQAVYAVMQRKIQQSGYPWIHDYTSVFDKHSNEYIFTDDCHFSANGNQIIAEALEKVIKNLD